ncbi:hypothetical protein GGI43DRAFT_389185 [Trichoderma evansii]
MAGIECHNETYQMLSHGRFLGANYTQGLKYGHVYGNITAKSGSCVTKGMRKISSSSQKRWFSALFAYAALWFSGISFAGQFFNAACQITNQFNQHAVGRPVCIGASILTAMGGGSNLWQAWILLKRLLRSNLHLILIKCTNKEVDIKWNCRELLIAVPMIHLILTMFHGYENRNLTWAEFYGANIT